MMIQSWIYDELYREVAPVILKMGFVSIFCICICWKYKRRYVETALEDLASVASTL